MRNAEGDLSNAGDVESALEAVREQRANWQASDRQTWNTFRMDVPARVAARFEEHMDRIRAVAAQKGMPLEGDHEAFAVLLHVAGARMQKKLAAFEGRLH